MPTPHGTQSRRTSIAAGLVLVLVAVVAFLWSARCEPPAAPAGATTVSRQPTSVARAASPQPRGRTLRWSTGVRQAVHLAGAQAVAEPSDRIGTLEGRVVSSSSGRSVARAQLSFAAGEQLHAVSADGEGKFRFQPPRPGVYELAVVTAEGYLAFAPEWGHSPVVFTAMHGRGIRGATIYLSPAVVYQGQVVDPNGEPVAGAIVARLGGGVSVHTLAKLQRHYRTDEQGRFRFHSPDHAVFEARKEPYAPGRARVGFSVQVSHRMIIRLGPPGSGEPRVAEIAGEVHGPDGAGVPDALVVARFEPEHPARSKARLNAGGRAQADEAGAFTVRGLLPGRYTVVASSPGYAAATQRGVRAPAADLRLRLTSGGVLSGTVREADTEEPVVAFTVVVSRSVGPLTHEVVTAESTFDPEGRYEIPALRAGTYRVTVSAHGYATPDGRPVTITEGRAAIADFALGRGGSIAGLVRDAETDQPLEGARASLESTLGQGAESIPLRIAATTGVQGQFELRGLRPGERTLLVAAAGHHGRIVASLLVRDGETTGPITVKLSPTQPDEEPRIELAGIGAVLSAQDETLVIGRLIDHGGAAEAGLVVGDAILNVDGASVVELGFQGSIDRIRGPEGTSVTLTVRRAGSGDVETIVVVRKRIRA